MSWSSDNLRRLSTVLTAAVFIVGVGVATMRSVGPGHRASVELAMSPAATSGARASDIEPDERSPRTAPAPPVPAPPAPAPVVAPKPRPTVVVAAAAAAPAPTPEPASTPQERGTQALARIDYPWERLGFSISFEGPRQGLLGKADCNTDRISIYVRPEQSLQRIAFVTAFELGHAVDCNFMNDRTRSEWASIRGFASGWRWFPDCLCTEDNYGSGDISMVFANWLVPNSGYRWRSNLAPPPSAEQLQRLVPYLQR